jgi:simple sugar transport system permease protein
MSAQFDPVTRLPLIGGTRIHFGVVIVFLLVPVVYYFLWHTPLGFRLRAVGSRASVARYAGIHVERVIVLVLVLSGALAGVAGLMEVSTLHFRLKAGISGGYGFSAVLVALLGRMNPFGVAVASLLFAALFIGAQTMNVLANVPPELADAIQAVIVLSVLGVDALVRRRMEWVELVCGGVRRARTAGIRPAVPVLAVWARSSPSGRRAQPGPGGSGCGWPAGWRPPT